MIVHLGTKVETLFGVVDSDGNLIKQIPLTAQLPVVNAENLANVGAQIELQRRRLVAEDAAANPVPKTTCTSWEEDHTPDSGETESVIAAGR